MTIACSALRLPALFGLMLLAGCGGGEPQFPPSCEARLDLRPDAADVTRYRPGGLDLTDMALDARITAIPAKCSMPDAKTVVTTLGVNFAVTRGPAAKGRDAVLPYFVAVMRGGQILDEQDYQLQVVFPPNIDTVALGSPQITLRLPVGDHVTAADYTISAAFRLTPEELAANRARVLRH